jgi:hypothetical protein
VSKASENVQYEYNTKRSKIKRATLRAAGLSGGGHSGLRGYSWNISMAGVIRSRRRMPQICTMWDILGIIEIPKNNAATI